MVDLITVGRVGIDLFYKGESIDSKEKELRLKLGHKYFVEELHEGIGGGAANVAAAAVKNGAKAGVYGLVGNNPFKQIILGKMKELDISTDFCQFRDNYLNISSIFVMTTGERTIVDYETPHRGDFLDPKMYSLFENTKAVYLASLPDVDLSERVNFLSHMQTKGKMTMVNIGVRDHTKHTIRYTALLEHADILIMNKTEYCSITDQKEDSVNLKDEQKLPDHLLGKTLIITDGRQGSFGYSKGSASHQEAIPVERVVDTTGAGDAYAGAFIADYLKHKDLTSAMECGSRHASLIISKVGAN